jgi:hypothetical protein
MSFNFQNLDEKTRQLMVEEVETARATGNLYFSKRFNDLGNARWPDLLREAAAAHTEHWLAYMIEAGGLMKGVEVSRTRSGGYTTKHVPNTAAETLAEGQFNRFYIIGVCRRAIAEGKNQVIVYRAKERTEHRPESEALIGKAMSAAELITALRSVQSSLGHELLKPNSGLSVHL